MGETRLGEGERRLSRQVVGAYVLYPERPAQRSHGYGALIRNENIGAIPLLPGEEGGAAPKAFVGEILGKRTKEAHTGAGIPARRTFRSIVKEPLAPIMESGMGQILDNQQAIQAEHKALKDGSADLGLKVVAIGVRMASPEAENKRLKAKVAALRRRAGEG